MPSYQDDDDSSDQSKSNSFGSLTSQPSLPSVPSLTLSHLQLQQLQQQFPSIHYHCLATLKGHSSYISSITFAGKLLFTGSSDREIRSWNRDIRSLQDTSHDIGLMNNNNIVVADQGNGAVKSMVVSADKLFTAHQDHKIRVWRISNDDHHHPPPHHDQQIRYTRLATLPTFSDRALSFLTPSNHAEVRRNKRCTASWVHHVDTVSALALSPDGTLLYSVSWDRTLKIWSTADFKCLESVPNAHEDAINAVALSCRGDVYTGSADKKIKVWRKKPGERTHSLVATLEKHNSGINALAVSVDGAVLYSGASDRSILVWEADGSNQSMAVVGALRGHTKAVLCFAVVSDLVCSGSADKTVRIWRGSDRNYCCLAVLHGHKGPVKCLAATVESRHSYDQAYLVYSGSLDCDTKVWEITVPST